jgi:hypothetical protein
VVGTFFRTATPEVRKGLAGKGGYKREKKSPLPSVP